MSAEDDHRLRSDGVHRPRVAHDYVGFDYDAIEGDAHEPREIPKEALIEAMRLVITQFCMWQTSPDSLRPLRADTVGLRSIAALWVLKPEAFDNDSLHSISKRCGCSDSILSRYAGQFSDQFGVRSASQLRPEERNGRKCKAGMAGTPPPR